VLAEALQASDKAVRLRTIECITANVSITRPLLPHLQAALDDAEPQVRLTAAGALHYLGEDAAPALPVLLRLTRDMDEGVRYSALSTAVRTGVQSEALISALKQALYEADVEMRCLAC
jgi:HEAT repeat protein